MASTQPNGARDIPCFGPTGYFRLERPASGRWWLVDPDGIGFLSIGVSHAEETNLKYPNNLDVWRRKYGSREGWIRAGVVRDLEEWGFNTIGWTSEHVSGRCSALPGAGLPIHLGYSTPWTNRDFQIADMPYCVGLRVAEIEEWNGFPSFPDVYSEEFDAYCEYLARSVCTDHAEDPKLVGYFLVDMPAWNPHPTGQDFPQLHGLDERERNIKLYDIAFRYYETISKHIRARDPNHLILGDRYNGNASVPTPVLAAMKFFVDVLSVAFSSTPDGKSHAAFREDLRTWHEYTAKAVMLADVGNWCNTATIGQAIRGLEDQAARGQDYVETITGVLAEPWFVGWHCAGYIENPARGYGLKDSSDEPYHDFVRPVRELNESVYERILGAVGDGTLESSRLVAGT